MAGKQAGIHTHLGDLANLALVGTSDDLNQVSLLHMQLLPHRVAVLVGFCLQPRLALLELQARTDLDWLRPQGSIEA